MSRRFLPAADDYERTIADIARQEGFNVETTDSDVFFVIRSFSPSGEEVLSKVNITRFADAIARARS
ncbi:hypothetical protein RJJ65_07015 [Rhizobium hidalgonense]|uniref:Uncharacterized protein n=1 Tax=Rhizobium hidalgonense TaxID=1538159 RepID=A0A2A6K2U7_9HYPH|nr:hypothetical protein [Rhizobium hidalgonense]MDR9772408.1 hypothetical protein [Rhizobium hidalgonense]MDR9811405.1 hypothetical protein [Rhizobium hidalgonense]MDR9821531.1 hypothetical protein [Rhizobium hidalgonense]PDT19033.1 hypothetical protein CO674_35410 [Rhizobium hidalgonense]PON03758.1 hypothetical protein ATY29_30570 [Rhizobium hidalgonense]